MQPLINLDEYKTYAVINSVEYDTKIDAIITAISALVRVYCARNFLIEDPIVDYYNGGSTSTYTKEFPIVSITSVEKSVDYGKTYTPLAEYTDYVVNISKDQIYFITEDSIEIPNKYKITYIGGYETVPEDLKLALFDLVNYYHKNETTGKKTSHFVSLEYITTSDFPSHIKRILDLYRVI